MAYIFDGTTLGAFPVLVGKSYAKYNHRQRSHPRISPLGANVVSPGSLLEANPIYS